MIYSMTHFRHLLKTNDPKYSVSQYQAFEDPILMNRSGGGGGGGGVSTASSSSCMGNGCRMKGGVRTSSLNSVHHDDMTEFMTSNCCCSGGSSTGVESVGYRSQGNATIASSVSTIPMSLNVPVPPPPSFRFRVGEYSEERKRSFVRLSRKYRQTRHSSAQVRD